MNREKALKWCKTASLDYRWPNSTKWQAPEGWRWVVSNRPYQLPSYKLINAEHEEINKEDFVT